ncbi:uncharacterized protein G2W53_003512 [Senna tora]|uniref:CCHC-type domain-containing protein n=1 Tax=Senna tora TaxID=362788 RepID=A0A835CGH2_9FABA|nr:uncharacterized protein G2W53_003512 [Senna tora]
MVFCCSVAGLLSLSLLCQNYPKFALPRQGHLMNFNQEILKDRAMLWSKRVIAALVDWKDMPMFRLQFIINDNWLLQGKVTVKAKHNNFFILEFSNTQDKQFMLENGPWTVQNSLLTLYDWQPGIAVENLKVGKVAIWLRFTGVPMEFICNRVAYSLGQLAGEVIQLDPLNDKEENIQVLRVKVMLDLEKPLLMGAFLPIYNGQKVWVTCTPERAYRVCEQCGRLGHLDRDCNWTVHKTSVELQGQRNNLFAKFGYDYWIDTQNVLFQCPKRKFQEWLFRGSTLIQVGYNMSTVAYNVFEQYSGHPSLSIYLQNQYSGFSQRISKANLQSSVIEQEQDQQGLPEKVNMAKEVKVDSSSKVIKGQMEPVISENEDCSLVFVPTEDKSQCDDGFLSSHDYGYDGNIDDILKDFTRKSDTNLKDLEVPMDIDDLLVHQIQGAVVSLQKLDHVEFPKVVNQENDDMKNQEGTQIRGHVVVELDFNHSSNQILSQLNLPTRIKDMLEDKFKGWSQFDSQEASSSFTYHLTSDFMRQGEGLALMVRNLNQGKPSWEIIHRKLKAIISISYKGKAFTYIPSYDGLFLTSPFNWFFNILLWTFHLTSHVLHNGLRLTAKQKVEMSRLAGSKTGVGGKRLREFVQHKKRKKPKVQTTVGQNNGFKRKRRDMEDLILEEHNSGTGFKRIKEAITDLTMKPLQNLQRMKGIWEASLIRPPKEE